MDDKLTLEQIAFWLGIADGSLDRSACDIPSHEQQKALYKLALTVLNKLEETPIAWMFTNGEGDDDVRELSRKCAEAVGYEIDLSVGGRLYHYDEKGAALVYDPATDPAQAFELLCWLAERGIVRVSIADNAFRFHPRGKEVTREIDLPCRDIAELRLAIMRATVKVHEGSKP